MFIVSPWFFNIFPFLHRNLRLFSSFAFSLCNKILVCLIFLIIQWISIWISPFIYGYLSYFAAIGKLLRPLFKIIFWFLMKFMIFIIFKNYPCWIFYIVCLFFIVKFLLFLLFPSYFLQAQVSKNCFNSSTFLNKNKQNKKPPNFKKDSVYAWLSKCSVCPSDTMTSFIFEFSALHMLNKCGNYVVQLFTSSHTFRLVI